MPSAEEPLQHFQVERITNLNSGKPQVPAIDEEVPCTRWTARCHPSVDRTSQDVNNYFLERWRFPTEKSREKFLAAGFSRVTCLYFPLALEGRIHLACRLLTVLFLVDDLLEDLSLEEGERYNSRLISISNGTIMPNRDDAAETILYDLWEEMRKHDEGMTRQVIESTIIFMRAQTDKTRLTIKSLGAYLTYRERDVGQALLAALMRFTMDLQLDEAALQKLVHLDQNCARHISVVNDIYSFNKELRASKAGHKEGSHLCSAVKVMADETHLDYTSTKRVLWSLVREWEAKYEKMVKDVLSAPSAVSDAGRRYIKGLEYQMSGNEAWSKITLRYK